MRAKQAVGKCLAMTSWLDMAIAALLVRSCSDCPSILHCLAHDADAEFAMSHSVNHADIIHNSYEGLHSWHVQTS